MRDKLNKRVRRIKAFFRRLSSPRVASLHGVVATTDPSLVPRNIWRALYEGVYEAEEARACRNNLQPGDRVLELGGGIGLISVISAQICGSENVVTYEANPSLEAIIRRNYQLNGVAPQLRLKAISTQRGSTTFFANSNVLSSSLIQRKGASGIDVELDSIGDVCEELRPTCIVCDIEGAEIDVLPAADLSDVRLLVVEVHPHVVGEEKVAALIRHIEAQGFRTELHNIQLVAVRDQRLAAA